MQATIFGFGSGFFVGSALMVMLRVLRGLLNIDIMCYKWDIRSRNDSLEFNDICIGVAMISQFDFP